FLRFLATFLAFGTTVRRLSELDELKKLAGIDNAPKFSDKIIQKMHSHVRITYRESGDLQCALIF
ncbi:unnamed protein product, partial [Ceratitis capitata]